MLKGYTFSEFKKDLNTLRMEVVLDDEQQECLDKLEKYMEHKEKVVIPSIKKAVLKYNATPTNKGPQI